MRRYPDLPMQLDRCIAIAMAQKRFMRSSLKETLFSRGLYPDLHQELAAAGVEAWRLGYDPDRDFYLVRNLAQRRLYAWLKANGIHRHWDPRTKKQGKGFFVREVAMPNIALAPAAKVAGATDFLRWCEDVITARLGREAWEEVMRWANSRQPEPQGKARQAISILKGVLR